MNTLTSINNWFATAEKFASLNASAQAGCMLEEVQETLQALKLSGDLAQLATDLKAGDLALQDIDRKETLDGLCDIIVTVVGLAHLLNFDLNGALAEVDRSNWSKFEHGVPVMNGLKIAKGRGYEPPNLEDFY